MSFLYLPDKKFRDELINWMLEMYDTLLFAGGERSIRLRLPLIFGKEEIDKLFNNLYMAIDNLVMADNIMNCRIQ